MVCAVCLTMFLLVPHLQGASALMGKLMYRLASGILWRYWGWHKMTAISHTSFSTFFWILMKISLEFVPKCPSDSESWLVQLDTEQVTSHFLNQLWYSCGITWPWWANQGVIARRAKYWFEFGRYQNDWPCPYVINCFDVCVGCFQVTCPGRTMHVIQWTGSSIA